MKIKNKSLFERLSENDYYNSGVPVVILPSILPTDNVLISDEPISAWRFKDEIYIDTDLDIDAKTKQYIKLAIKDYLSEILLVKSAVSKSNSLLDEFYCGEFLVAYKSE